MNQALLRGAEAALRDGRDFSGWQSMITAPHDGTWVELKCTYGVAPWYCVARWTDECVALDQHGSSHTFKSSLGASWQKPEGGGPSDEESLHWRPFMGTPQTYVDPTGGMQNDMAYWRGAVAAKRGLPLDAFEKTAARNARNREKQEAIAAPAKRSWFDWFFGLS